MAPRNRFSLDDLTDEELEELAADFGGAVPLPRARGAAPMASRMEIGEIEMLGPGSEDAWLDELIDRPQVAPAAPQLSAAGPAGGFVGEDTPQARELIKQRGMQVTTPPSDDELLDPSAFDRPAAPLEPVEDDGWLDDLIAQQGAAMDSEQAAPGGPMVAPRRSREAELAGLIAAPTRGQGIAAILGDALFGSNNVERLQARGTARQNMLAQARMQDVAAGERSDERAADREMIDARLGVQLRGQDLADARAEQSRRQQLQLAEQADRRARELETQRETAAEKRARIIAEGRARGQGPELTPQDENAQLSGYLQQQTNASKAEADAYAAGQTEGIPAAKLERMEATASQFKTLPPTARNEAIKQGLGRAAMQQDKEEPLRLEARNELLEVDQVIAEAEKAWSEMSERDKQVMATVGGGDSWLASTARDAGLSKKGQVQAAAIQELANIKIKLQNGASVTANEWRRSATAIGLPKDPVSPFNSPDSLDAWIKNSKKAFFKTYDSVLKTYPGLFDGMESP